MTPIIKLDKTIIQDDPRDLVCYVTLTVTNSSDIPRDIFVVKYIPPISATNPSERLFYNVAYVDQLFDLSTEPDNKYKPCFLLSHTVTKAFANKTTAEQWCIEIYAEIRRLISTYMLQDTAGSRQAVSITELGYKEEQVTNSVDVDVDITIPEESSLSSESSSSYNMEAADIPAVPEEDIKLTSNTIELTFDGKEIII